MVALQQDNALTDKPEYVAFVLIFILFGLAIVAACLNLLVLRLVTLNTEDERRDEAAAVKVTKNASILLTQSILAYHGRRNNPIDVCRLISFGLGRPRSRPARG